MSISQTLSSTTEALNKYLKAEGQLTASCDNHALLLETSSTRKIKASLTAAASTKSHFYESQIEAAGVVLAVETLNYEANVLRLEAIKALIIKALDQATLQNVPSIAKALPMEANGSPLPSKSVHHEELYVPLCNCSPCNPDTTTVLLIEAGALCARVCALSSKYVEMNFNFVGSMELNPNPIALVGSNCKFPMGSVIIAYFNK